MKTADSSPSIEPAPPAQGVLFPHFVAYPYFQFCSEPCTSASSPQNKRQRKWTKSSIKRFFESLSEYALFQQRPVDSFSNEEIEYLAGVLRIPYRDSLVKYKETIVSGSLKPGTWSASEIEMLASLVSAKYSWPEISSQMAIKLYGGVRVRTTKQCKARWVNHHDPKIEKGNWSPEEDVKLLLLFKDKGRKWRDLARAMGNRTEFDVKNRVSSLLVKEDFYLKAGETTISMADTLIESLRQKSHFK